MSSSTGCNRNVAPPRTVLAQYEGPVRSRDVITGLNIYQTVCSVCHAGRVNPAGYHWSPGQMRQQIRRGNRLMPPLGHELLSDAQVEAVLAYLVGTDAVEGELPPLTREDVARERRGITESRVAQERRRRALLEELDPDLRPPAQEPSAVDGAAPGAPQDETVPGGAAASVDTTTETQTSTDDSAAAGEAADDAADESDGTNPEGTEASSAGAGALAPPR